MGILVKGVSVGESVSTPEAPAKFEEKSPAAVTAPPGIAPPGIETSQGQASAPAQWLSGLIDALLFIAILGFSAVAMLALALAAPLAITASAIAGGLSALTARSAKRGGWTIAGA